MVGPVRFLKVMHILHFVVGTMGATGLLWKTLDIIIPESMDGPVRYLGTFCTLYFVLSWEGPQALWFMTVIHFLHF